MGLGARSLETSDDFWSRIETKSSFAIDIIHLEEKKCPRTLCPLYDQNMVAYCQSALTFCVSPNPSDQNNVPQKAHRAGRLGSTVPFNLAVSGTPSPFLLLSGSFEMSTECLVSVFESPSCLPDCVVRSPVSLEDAPYVHD